MDISVGVWVVGGAKVGTYQSLASRYPSITEHVHVEIRKSTQLIDPAALIPWFYVMQIAKLILSIIAATLFIAGLSHHASASANANANANANAGYPSWPDCTAPLPDGSETYQDFPYKLCEGKAALEKGDPETAIRALQEADAMRLFEAPNFKALSLLAFALKTSGANDEAQYTAQISGYTLDIVLGRLACPTVESNDGLLQGEHVLTSPAHLAAQNKMCGGMYEAYYGNTHKNREWVAGIDSWLALVRSAVPRTQPTIRQTY